MLNSFSKCCLTLSSALLLNTMADSLIASECCDPCNCNRFYIGAFGGGIYSNSSQVSQMGIALFSEAVGGPLAVEARGHTHTTSSGYGGVQFGYEWSNCVDECSCWAIAPTVELEGYWFRRHLKGHLINLTDADRLPERDFLNSFHMNSGVYLANFILSLNNVWKLSPYVGGGIGATRISLHSADSLQVDPIEVGINHFNSRTEDASWAFAAQVKAGLRYKFCNFHIFGEYRYLFVDFSNYIFGSTVYPTHVRTTPWNIKFNNMQYNAFAFGIQYDL